MPADRSTESGAIGALLRREGRYSSHLTTWRRQREAGELAPGAGKQRGRKPDKQAQELAKLEQENERLRAQLAQAELIITAQKNFGYPLGGPWSARCAPRRTSHRESSRGRTGPIGAHHSGLRRF